MRGRYTHFFYTLSPRAPYRLLATSAEFCVSAAQSPRDCESIQFISGLALQPAARRAVDAQGQQRNGTRLIMSYGVNDCEARLLFLPLERVWKLLKPMPDTASACFSQSGR